MNIGATDIIGDGSKGYYSNWGSKDEYKPSDPDSSQAFLESMDARLMNNALPSSYDAANDQWKGDWFMPTKDQCDKLLSSEYCNWTYDEELNCYVVSSSKEGDDRLILLPAIGHYEGSSYDTENHLADYWTSTSGVGNNAYCMQLSSSVPINKNCDVSLNRDYACPIRPVLNIPVTD